jgi:hypothetical protein
MCQIAMRQRLSVRPNLLFAVVFVCVYTLCSERATLRACLFACRVPQFHKSSLSIALYSGNQRFLLEFLPSPSCRNQQESPLCRIVNSAKPRIPTVSLLSTVQDEISSYILVDKETTNSVALFIFQNQLSITVAPVSTRVRLSTPILISPLVCVCAPSQTEMYNRGGSTSKLLHNTDAIIRVLVCCRCRLRSRPFGKVSVMV